MVGDGYYRDVSNLPFPPQPSAPPPWPPVPTKSARSSLLLVIASLAIALIALGVAIGGWFRPPPPKAAAKPTYSSQQVADAKAAVCAAYDKVHSAIGVTMGRDGGSDSTSQLAVATSARQALLAGSIYLQTTLSEEPATAPDLAAAIRKLTNLFRQYTIDYLNGRTNADMESSLRDGDETTSTINGLCK
jgi:hypothetical protein